MRRLLATVIALAAIYALTLASAHVLDLVAGVLLGAAVGAALRGRLLAGPTGARPAVWTRIAGFPLFAAAVLVDVLAGTLDVTLRVVGLRPLHAPGIIRVPIGERSERGVAISALATTLSPGTVFVDIDGDDMLLHVIDASDPDAARAKLERFYDRYQRRVFP